MKKIRYIILFIFIFVCCGCSYKYGSTTRAIRHSGFSISGDKFTCDSLFFKDKINEEVKFYIGNYFISESGTVYEINLGKKYSNEMNCKKPDFNKKVISVLDFSIVKGKDNNYYYLGGKDDIPQYSKVDLNNEDYPLYDLLLGDTDVIKASTINAKDGVYYVLKDDGNIYLYKIIKNDKEYILQSKDIIYNKKDYNAKIIDFNYNGSSTSTFIKTKDNYYRMKVVNSEKCSKYADVRCKYKMMLDKGLSEQKDRILAYNGNNLITTYGKTYTVNN